VSFVYFFDSSCSSSLSSNVHTFSLVQSLVERNVEKSMFLHQQKQTWEQLSRELEAKEDRVAAIVKEAFRNLTTRAKEDQARDQGCREGSRRSPGSSGGCGNTG
jgi:hypothetical protein